MRSIALGIGDILITKLLFDTYQIKDDIIINRKIVSNYRNNSQEYFDFIHYLIKKLFNNHKIIVIDDDNVKLNKYQNRYRLIYNPNISLKNYFNVEPYFDYPYIVFFTKVRLDGSLRLFNRQKFRDFCTKAKFKSKIVILGERYISDVHEKKVHNIQEVYNELLLLGSSNNIVDLTAHELICKPNITTFERDIRILANAECVIGLGIGGNFVMSTMLSDNYKFFIGSFQHAYIDYLKRLQQPSKKLFGNLDAFLNNILCIS